MFNVLYRDGHVVPMTQAGLTAGGVGQFLTDGLNGDVPVTDRAGPAVENLNRRAGFPLHPATPPG